MHALTTVPDVEHALAEVGVSVARLCRRAEIAESTWHRWKIEGRQPRAGNWMRVQRAARELIGEAAQPSAA